MRSSMTKAFRHNASDYRGPSISCVTHGETTGLAASEYLIPSVFVSDSSRIDGERKQAGVRLSIARATTGVINVALF